MTDDPIPPSNPAIDAIDMIRETVNELTALDGMLPAPASDAEKVAKILDRASEDIAEVAVLVRRAATREQRFRP